MYSNNRKRQKGGALVEFAVIAPVLFLTMFGAADFSRAVAVKIAVQNASDAAANFAAQASMQPNGPCPPSVDISGIQQAAVNDIGARAGFTATAQIACGATTAGNLTVGGPCACNNSTGTFVQVSTSIPFTTIAPYPGVPASFTINGASTVRVY